jgi:hypothetical protein
MIVYLSCGDQELVAETNRDGSVSKSGQVSFDFPASEVHLFGDQEALDSKVAKARTE